ncbi:MAG: GerMN domain-containing protein [Candidatus Metalachnospira sp.]|nr:GerMN domain-containing protein [Candidatus Metalachnospira sp.]
MKKSIIKTAVLLYIIIFSLCACAPEAQEITQPHSEDGILCDIYYVDNLTQTLKSDTVSLESEKQNDLILEAYGKLSDIEKTEETRSAVPEGLEINKIRLDSGILNVDFNAVYNSMTAGEELMFKTALVYTFTSFDFVDYVYITVDGNDLKMTNGLTMGKLGRNDIVKDGDISAEPTNYEILTLYFENGNGTELNTEIREVEVNPNLPLERYVIEQLIKGPEDLNLISTIPSDTKIRDISTADGICYVDLSSDFVVKQSDREKDSIAAIYSIVNSLGEIEGISKVQFLIEGEKIDDYKNIMDLSKAVEPNYDISFN